MVKQKKRKTVKELSVRKLLITIFRHPLQEVWEVNFKSQTHALASFYNKQHVIFTQFNHNLLIKSKLK